MKKIKILGALAVVALGVATILPVGDVMGVTCPSGTQRAGETVKSATQCNVPKDDTSVNLNGENGIFGTIINVLISITAIVSVIMIIIGGIHLATSQGDPGKVKKGKDTILYGVIGLAVAVLAFAIINFVIDKL